MKLTYLAVADEIGFLQQIGFLTPIHVSFKLATSFSDDVNGFKEAKKFAQENKGQVVRVECEIKEID